jgi:hypothetical protein
VDDSQAMFHLADEQLVVLREHQSEQAALAASARLLALLLATTQMEPQGVPGRLLLQPVQAPLVLPLAVVEQPVRSALQQILLRVLLQ